MSGRSRIIEALKTVEGINPHATTPDAPTAGDAWPVWTITNYGGKLSMLAVNEYAVLVLLPAGHALSTVELADGLTPQVAAALSKIGTVTTAEPVAIQVATGSVMPGLRLRVTPREATR